MDSRWYEVGKEWKGSNPPIYTYETVLGHDPQGREWRARATANGSAWQVWFDHMDDASPFLREEEVYADSYWKAMREVHGLVNCHYGDVMNVVRKFMHEHDITKER